MVNVQFRRSRPPRERTAELPNLFGSAELSWPNSSAELFYYFFRCSVPGRTPELRDFSKKFQKFRKKIIAFLDFFVYEIGKIGVFEYFWGLKWNCTYFGDINQ